jgi:uncharacterized membrane protein YedE/YeeE
MRLLLAALSGALFGLGLMVSGMTDTTKVQGWLDIFGNWDPTLAFVIGGAILPMAIAWICITPRGASLLGSPLPTPPGGTIDRPLVLGAAIFGSGWALVGLCPGPALASLSYGGVPGLIFLVSMVAGMALTPSIRARVPALQAT